MARITVLCFFLLCSYGCSADPADDDDSGGSAEGTTVQFTVYTDAECTQLPPSNSVVDLDTTVECNATPDSSISELVCFEDRITYTNHPNSNDCSASGISNELLVGVCQEFPGPVATWKYIDGDSYDCLTSA